MSIRDALLLRPYTGTLKSGVAYTLRRPSALDLLETMQLIENKTNGIPLMLVMRHLIEDGKPVFNSVAEVNACDGLTLMEIYNEIEMLYGEGRD